MTITFVPFWVVLILGVIAIAIGIIKENAPSSSLFWWWASIWVTALALLGLR